LDEVPYQAEKNGERYRVLERHYAIFPERSGELTIPALQLTGRLVERRADRLWQPTVRGRRIRVESEPIVLTIQPRPAAFTGEYWQPARGFNLTQQVSATDALRVGEPVTRTVIVDAVGLEENMIAEPRWPELADARIYPDQPQGITRDDGNWVLGTEEFRYALVPENPGQLVVPEIRLDWWDTVANRQQTAFLPSRTVEVSPSVLAGEMAQVIAPVQTAVPGMGVSAETAGDAAHSSVWRWLTLAFALLWLATLYLWLRTPGRNGAKVPAREIPDTERELLRRLRRACKAEDEQAARRLLRQWVANFGPPAAQGSVLRFASVSNDSELQQVIYDLDAGRFGSAEGQAGVVSLWKIFSTWHEAYANRSRNSGRSRLDLWPDPAMDDRRPA